jgi:hypothetical protein
LYSSCPKVLTILPTSLHLSNYLLSLYLSSRSFAELNRGNREKYGYCILLETEVIADRFCSVSKCPDKSSDQKVVHYFSFLEGKIETLRAIYLIKVA